MPHGNAAKKNFSDDSRVYNTRPLGSFRHGEPKGRHNFSLTAGAFAWLKLTADNFGVPSVSELLEQIAQGRFTLTQVDNPAH